MILQFLYLAILALFAAFFLARTIYRLYLHPLSRFPGPKLTAATGLVEIYYDVVRGGKFLWEMEKMHETYGIYSLFLLRRLRLYIMECSMRLLILDCRTGRGRCCGSMMRV
jgi:hypothetical protein